MNKMKTYIYYPILFIFSISIIYCSDSVICFKNLESQAVILPNSVDFEKDRSIWFGSFKNIYHLSPQGEIIKKYDYNYFGNLERFYVINVRNGLIAVRALEVGWTQIIIFNKDGKIIARCTHHGDADKVFFDISENTIIVGGFHYTEYAKWLKLYNEHTLTPSQFYIEQFKKFYRTKTAYTLAKYDLNLNLIDSCDFVDRKGENAKAYGFLWSKEVFDQDQEGNIYLVHRSRNYLIRKYNPDFRLIKEFQGTNPNFIPISDTLTLEQTRALNYTPNSYSGFYYIYKVADIILVGFYSNPAEDWESFLKNPKYYYDIYNDDGKKLGEGVLPYAFVAKKEPYLYVAKKDPRKWKFGKDDHYLVRINIDDLTAGKITAEWIDQQVEDFKNAGG